MEPDMNEIEKTYRKRISLFKDLLDCIDNERDYLINQDINGLWASLDEKAKIVESIRETGDYIKKIAGNEPTYQDIPLKDRSSFRELYRTLSNLREEIKVRVVENVSFISETLDFFHDIVTTLTQTGAGEDSYGPIRNNLREFSHIYHSEV